MPYLGRLWWLRIFGSVAKDGHLMQRQLGETDAVERGADVVHSLHRQSEQVLVHAKLAGPGRDDDQLSASALDVAVLKSSDCHMNTTAHHIASDDGVEREIDGFEDVAVVRG